MATLYPHSYDLCLCITQAHQMREKLKIEEGEHEGDKRFIKEHTCHFGGSGG